MHGYSRAVLAVSALILAGTALAQQRIVVDLPLPPPSVVRAPSPATTLPANPAPAASTALADAAQAGDPLADPSSTPEKSEPPSGPLLLTLRPGESLYHLFSRHALSQADLVGMAANKRIKARLRRLQPGQRLAVHASPSGQVQHVYLQMPGPGDQVIERAEKGFRLRNVPDADDFISTPATSVASATNEARTDEDEPAGAPQAPVQVVDAANVPARVVPALASATAGGDGTGSQATESDRTVVRAKPEPRLEPHQGDAVVQNVTVKPGDSLYTIFKRAGVPPQELARLLEAGTEAQRLRRLQPGQEVTLNVSTDGVLHDMSVVLDETQTLRAVRDGDAFSLAVEIEPLERRTASASAVIEDALFLAGQREGLSDRLIMELIEIFGWDVDFALDVRAGDHFTVLFEELYKDGVKIGDGHILASEFVNRGRSVRAVRFVDETGRSEYFTPEGLSMRKAFLRTPVKFSRISSRFSRGRMHPVLQRMRAHKGVDYAAPTGTPVRAAGDGRVDFAGWKGGYGRAVILQHGSTYTTLYGHLSRLHKNARTGGRVQQGSIIGYVGQTGLATGPHLHYEFRVRGVHQDPLRVKLPKALPIDERYKRDFLRDSAPLVAQLDRLARTRVASRN